MPKQLVFARLANKDVWIGMVAGRFQTFKRVMGKTPITLSEYASLKGRKGVDGKSIFEFTFGEDGPMPEELEEKDLEPEDSETEEWVLADTEA